MDLESFFLSEHPADPVLSNCPTFVIEGDDVTCSCQTSGSPPAVVTWVVGGTTDSKVLMLRNVSRSLHGHNYTCSQYWSGVNSNWRTTYSVQVHCESFDVCNPQDRYAGSVITSVKKIFFKDENSVIFDSAFYFKILQELSPFTLSRMLILWGVRRGAILKADYTLLVIVVENRLVYFSG